MPYETLGIDRDIGRETHLLPHVTIAVYSVTEEFGQAARTALADRRMSRVTGTVSAGGLIGARRAYEAAPSPELLIIETIDAPDVVVSQLAELAEVCSSATEVVLVGHVNDVSFYRRLMSEGVKEYAVAPLTPLDLVEVAAKTFFNRATKLGRSLAFLGASGGVGSSTIATNVASTLGRCLKTRVILADLDVRFGNAALTFNTDTAQGLLQAMDAGERLDDVLLERLLTKHNDHLSLLTSPAALNPAVRVTEESVQRVLDIALAAAPFIVLDLPHAWSGWARQALMCADDVVITAAPTLTSLRNTKHLVEALRQARPNDPPPKVVLNQVGMRHRVEIPEKKFTELLNLPLAATVGFDINLVNLAATDGGAASERWPKSKTARSIEAIATSVSGRSAGRQASRWLRLTSWRKKAVG